VIRALRWRFVCIAMACLLVTLTLLCVGIAAGMYDQNAARADAAIALVQAYDGRFPEESADTSLRSWVYRISEETAYETRYFVVRLWDDAAQADVTHIAALDADTAITYARQMVQEGREKGYFMQYRFGIFETNGMVTVIALDCFAALHAFKTTIWMVVFMCVSCALIVFVLLVSFSGRVIRPFEENIKRQQRFITDASHELKTPLAVISANVDVLRAEQGDNRWLQSTQKQVARMDGLVHSLIELSRAQEMRTEHHQDETTDFSEAAQNVSEAFEAPAQARGCTLETQIAQGLFVRCSQETLVRLISILLDNAVKYCDVNGRIVLRVQKSGRQALVTLSNPCASLDKKRAQHLFDRFYRADDSRARQSGGYGIGLSVAQEIVTRCRGKITVSLQKQQVTFTVVLPLCAPVVTQKAKI
jgi:two-component system sensor histidine kinase CiaH